MSDQSICEHRQVASLVRIEGVLRGIGKSLEVLVERAPLPLCANTGGGHLWLDPDDEGEQACEVCNLRYRP